MSKRVRLVVAGLGGALALLVGVVVVPALGAPAPDTVRLHLGTDAQYFAFGAQQQPLSTAKNGCQLTSAEPLIDLSAAGNTKPGLANESIGVKSQGGGNGTPCGQVSGSEVLTLRPGSALTGRTFQALRLDLEMTGNAYVALTLSLSSVPSSAVTYRLQTGNSITAAQAGEPDYDSAAPYTVSSSPGDEMDACAAPNSSGPNNAGNDNCLWTVTPGFDFDTITLASPVGTVSLEGGADFGNSADHESLFNLSNTIPVAVDDFVATDEDVAATGNVLDNDVDGDGDSLAVEVNTDPAHGSLTLAADGAFTYTPDPDSFGPDEFTYSATDGAAISNTATVSITVDPVNDAPVAVVGDASTPEDTSVTITVATDVDSTDLTSTCTSTAGGVITDNGDGTVDYQPPVDFNGTDTVTCSVTDDEGATSESEATITVGVDPVNDAPVADDDIADVDENDSVVIDVLDNDGDVDEDTLTVANVSDPVNGTAVSTGTAVTYTPDPDFVGVDTFTYTANDGAVDSNAATVTVTVFPVLCSGDTVSDADGDVSGSFTRLTDSFDCKRYEVDAVAADGTVRFTPEGDTEVSYRGSLQFAPSPAPGGTGALSLLLQYDPTSGTDYQPVKWCVDPQFDLFGVVTGATLPAGETWCIASALNQGNANGDIVTEWQVYGVDDPRFK